MLGEGCCCGIQRRLEGEVEGEVDGLLDVGVEGDELDNAIEFDNNEGGIRGDELVFKKVLISVMDG